MSLYHVMVHMNEYDVYGLPTKVWRPMRPTGGEPYVFNSKRKAEQMASMCYPDCGPGEVKVQEVYGG